MQTNVTLTTYNYPHICEEMFTDPLSNSCSLWSKDMYPMCLVRHSRNTNVSLYSNSRSILVYVVLHTAPFRNILNILKQSLLVRISDLYQGWISIYQSFTWKVVPFHYKLIYSKSGFKLFIMHKFPSHKFACTS